MSLLCRLKNLVHKGILKETDLERIVIIPKGQEPCEDAISREELLKAIDTWDRFGVDDTNSLFRLDNLSLPHYVSYIHYDDVVKAIKGMPSIQPTDKENLVVGDCISRETVIEHYNSGEILQCNHVSRNNLLNYIEDLPPVTPKPKTEWIPVSERLPEDFQRVLVTIVNYKGDKVVRVAEYYNRKGVFQIKENHEQWEVGEKGLLAWMPLPEPYEAEKE